ETLAAFDRICSKIMGVIAVLLLGTAGLLAVETSISGTAWTLLAQDGAWQGPAAVLAGLLVGTAIAYATQYHPEWFWQGMQSVELDVWLGGAHDKDRASPRVGRYRFCDRDNWCRSNRGKRALDRHYRGSLGDHRHRQGPQKLMAPELSPEPSPRVS